MRKPWLIGAQGGAYDRYDCMAERELSMSDIAVATEGFTASADIRLATTIAGGDRDAFVALMCRFSGLLYRTARSIVRDDLGAESVVETAWLLAYRTIGTFTGETKLSIWLMRIVIDEALGRLRKASPASLACDPDLVRSKRRETRKRSRSSNAHPVSLAHDSAR